MFTCKVITSESMSSQIIQNEKFWIVWLDIDALDYSQFISDTFCSRSHCVIKVIMIKCGNVHAVHLNHFPFMLKAALGTIYFTFTFGVDYVQR